MQGSSVKLALLDPDVDRELAIVAADLLDEALGVLAPHESLDGVASGLVTESASETTA